MPVSYWVGLNATLSGVHRDFRRSHRRRDVRPVLVGAAEAAIGCGESFRSASRLSSLPHAPRCPACCCGSGGSRDRLRRIFPECIATSVAPTGGAMSGLFLWERRKPRLAAANLSGVRRDFRRSYRGRDFRHVVVGAAEAATGCGESFRSASRLPSLPQGARLPACFSWADQPPCVSRASSSA